MSNYIFSLVVGVVFIGVFYLVCVAMGAFIHWEAPTFAISEWTIAGRFGFFVVAVAILLAGLAGAWEMND